MVLKHIFTTLMIADLLIKHIVEDAFRVMFKVKDFVEIDYAGFVMFRPFIIISCDKFLSMCYMNVSKHKK